MKKKILFALVLLSSTMNFVNTFSQDDEEEETEVEMVGEEEEEIETEE
jgi:hypothetical protein